MENFDYKKWISENKVGPYSKMGKTTLTEQDIKPPAPENIYNNEPENDFDDSESNDAESQMEFYDRAWGLAGSQIKDAIDTLRQDGFEDEEIMDVLRTSVDLYDQAFGVMETESEETLKEYEIDCVERNGKYYMINDENEIVSGPYYDSDCTRRAR